MLWKMMERLEVSIDGRNITSLRFADDMDALAEEEEELEALFHGDPTDMRESTSVFQIRTINRSKLDNRKVSVIDSRRK